MTADEARALFASARVARLGTLAADGRPHLVPVVFAVDGDTVLMVIDSKPKRTSSPRRVENIARDPRVTLLADHYDDADWTALWWVRADGKARISGGPAPPVLVNRYAQYRSDPPLGPALEVCVQRWTGWRARITGAGGTA